MVYEKPFGTSLESFTELDRIAHETFEETQIYRIDHFLGKEATQDIHVLRFANGLFAGAWDRTHIESVEIDVPETLDVAMRASFYESTGAILDMLVTHLMQLAAEVAMDPPHCLEPECLAEAAGERHRLLSAPYATPTWWWASTRATGTQRAWPADSRTETFVAARMWVDNDRWDGVPFLLRTGKCLAESHQRVSVIFRDPVPGLPGSTDGPERARLRALRRRGGPTDAGRQGTGRDRVARLVHRRHSVGPGLPHAVAPGVFTLAARRPDGRPLVVHAARRAGPRLEGGQ